MSTNLPLAGVRVIEFCLVAAGDAFIEDVLSPIVDGKINVA
ncbi:MAG: hypothetical protein P8L66_07445 [Rhodospirillaceae bacterium]|nr:hypothetical protein [Rhodospirillaceae bacterium]